MQSAGVLETLKHDHVLGRAAIQSPPPSAKASRRRKDTSTTGHSAGTPLKYSCHITLCSLVYPQVSRRKWMGSGLAFPLPIRPSLDLITQVNIVKRSMQYAGRIPAGKSPLELQSALDQAHSKMAEGRLSVLETLAAWRQLSVPEMARRLLGMDAERLEAELRECSLESRRRMNQP